MTVALVFFAHTGLVVAAVLIAGQRAWQRVSAALILIGCFVLEWFAPVDLVSRTILTGGGMMALMATIKNASLATERWPIRQRLFHLIFLPLARRHRPGLGLTCAFLMSAAMHAWLVVGLGAFAASSIALFFSLQSWFIWVEDRLCVKAWPAPLARAWTSFVLIGLSPLIVIPFVGSFCL